MADMSPEQQNALFAARLKAVGTRQEKDLGTYTGTLGGSTRIKLQNIGLTTRIKLQVSIAYTVGVANATVAPLGWLNSINRVRLQDFDGQDRINASPRGIWLRNCLRERRIDGAHRDSLNAIGGSTAYATAGLTNPSYFLTAGSSGVLEGTLDVPLAFDYDAGDLRGMLASQSTVGETWLVIDWASLLYGNADDTKVFNGAATTTITAAVPSVTVIQEFILPQFDAMLGVVPLPQLDLLTVNELITYTSSDNLAAGQEKLLSFPNVRNIQSINYQWYHNSLLGGSSTTNDLTQHSIVVGGNTQLRKRTKATQLWSQRQEIGADLGKGLYFFDFSGLPNSGYQGVATAVLGNMQLGITPATSPSGSTYIEATLEQFYIKGTPLGAVAVSS